MNRFMGMMPSSTIKIRKSYDTGHGLKAHIDASDEGWTILYADGGSLYKDDVKSAEQNFQEALSIIKDQFMGLQEISGDEEEYDEESFDEIDTIDELLERK